MQVERVPSMHDRDFWTNCADAMEMSIEGDRLIAREIADAARRLYRWSIKSFQNTLQRLTCRYP
jgi:hypothetical protein